MTLFRRWYQLKKGKRVSLHQIDACISEACSKMDGLRRMSTSDSLASFGSKGSEFTRTEIMTMEKFQEVVPNLVQQQAQRIMTNTVRAWRQEYETPVGLSEALRDIGIMST